jgi:hypothetical protein
MQPCSDTLLVLRGDPSRPGGDQAAQDSQSEIGTKAERAILCAACGAVVTSTRYRVVVAGSHEHRFMNPAGLLFHIGCFAEAIGCMVVGPDSLEYPWFAGFSWRYAMCGNCGCHLGWHFRGEGKPGFFGLILDRLVQPTDD